MHDGQFLWIRATHGHTLKTVDVKSGLYVEPSAFVAFWAWIFSVLEITGVDDSLLVFSWEVVELGHTRHTPGI